MTTATVGCGALWPASRLASGSDVSTRLTDVPGLFVTYLPIAHPHPWDSWPAAARRFGFLSPARCEHFFGRLARLPIHARLGRPGKLIDVRAPEDPSGSAPATSRDLAGEDTHAKLGMRPGAPPATHHPKGTFCDCAGVAGRAVFCRDLQPCSPQIQPLSAAKSGIRLDEPEP